MGQADIYRQRPGGNAENIHLAAYRKTADNDKSIGENYSELEWKDVLYDALIGGILGGVGGAVDVARGGSETQKTASAEAAAKAAQAVEELGAKPSVAQTEVEANRLPGYSEQDVARREQFRTAEQTARKFGAELEVAELPSGVDGEYRDGKIVISPRATNPVMTVAVHELTHHMESSSRYGEFSRMVLDYVSNEMGVDVDAMKNAIRSEYARGGFALDDVGAERELVAKFAESKLFQDEAAINRLARTNRSLVQTVKDWISDMVVKLTGTEEEKFFRNAERLYEKALREVGDTTNSNGGRVQYSVNPSFANDVQAWNDAGQPSGDSFILGTTGDTLQGLGAIESDIFMNGDKISTIFAEHPEITLEEIKRIPEILDDPVLVLKSRNVGRGNSQNTRLIVFGTEKAQNGAPVMTVLDLRPVENNFVLEDMQQVSSTYTKRNPINFLNRSHVLHADEKRTVPLLRTMGFQIPIELQQYGSLGSISYDGQNVNINGVPFSSLILNQNASNGASATNTGRNQNTSNSYGRSFDDFSVDAQRLPTAEDSTSYTNALREMQQSGARQSASYADDLAHINKLLQNAALSPRDQAYIQTDIADAQRSCDAAMKVIANPGTTAEERAQAVQRAIDALDYARQRINDLGLPATQLGVSTAQDVLAEISEKLKPYLDELGGFRKP